MPYRIELRPAAHRDLKPLPRDAQERIGRKIESLATDPRPMGVEKLQGIENTYRVRVGNYRVLYQIHDQILLVVVLRIADRKEAYR